MANSQAVVSLYDEPMWESIRAERWQLQQCDDCSTFRYPPGPTCPNCLSMATTWRPLSGRAKIISWVVFHRQYFDNYKPPYNVVSVQLAEGPLVISNLVGDEPEGSWIGRDVEICYGTDNADNVIPQVRLAK
jgi:uncharacterized OB-fold protein